MIYLFAIQEVMESGEVDGDYGSNLTPQPSICAACGGLRTRPGCQSSS